MMKNIFYSIVVLAVMAACTGKTDLEQKKEELNGKKAELQELKKAITDLEAEIVELDPEFGNNSNNTVLVTTLQLKEQDFIHKIEVRGSVESRKNVTMSAQMPGEIEQIAVKEGQNVIKGQTLIRLDADVISNNIAELKTSLELATTIYEKRANLWKRNIGSEIQYLEAKNKKESLERKLSTAYAQLNQAVIRAPFSGSVDAIPAREGEMAQPGSPLIRIVNPNDVYIKADVSERFIGKFKTGDKVDIFFPSQDRNIESTVASVGQVINTENRTFELEVKLANKDKSIKPNQVALLELKDYEALSAVTIPTKLIQRDDKGNFVFKIQKEGENYVAHKAHISVGKTYKSVTEILEGLSSNEIIADKGFRELADGTIVRITEGKEEGKVASK